MVSVGRQSISLLIVLPIALPGIVTGVALNTMFTTWLGGLTFATLVIAHSTFCIVVIYNNAAARLRRTSGNLVEASMDLGASRAFTTGGSLGSNESRVVTRMAQPLCVSFGSNT